MEQDHPIHVEDTNQEALASKISAIKKGYFKDTYAEQFAKFKGKRDIIMHRGYWARVHIVRKLVQTMINSCENTQIIALGSGLQTLWYNLEQQNNLKNSHTFIQLDLHSVVKRKIKKIQNSKKIMNLFQSHKIKHTVSQNKETLICDQKYKITGCDLSDLQQFKSVIQKLKIDKNRPSFFYAECVLSYIDSDKIDQLLTYIKNQFKLVYFFDYQMYDPNDRFGQMMVKNFNLMGCPLKGIYKYPNLKDQNIRFQKCGYKNTECYTMTKIYYDCIDVQERKKIEKLQMLDQLEEWNLMMNHYFGLLSVTYKENVQKQEQYKILLKEMKLKK